MQEPSAGAVAIFGGIGGLIATGVGGLTSWVLYGDSNFFGRPVPIVVIVVLTAAFGLSADRVLTWLLSEGSSRASRHAARDGRPARRR